MTPAIELRARAAHLRGLAASWRHDLDSMGSRPRLRAGRSVRLHREALEPWHDRERAIVGALQLAADLERSAAHDGAALVLADVDVNPASPQGRVVKLHAAGLGYRAIARELGVPLGSVKTWCRRARLGGAA